MISIIAINCALNPDFCKSHQVSTVCNLALLVLAWVDEAARSEVTRPLRTSMPLGSENQSTQDVGLPESRITFDVYHRCDGRTVGKDRVFTVSARV